MRFYSVTRSNWPALLSIVCIFCGVTASADFNCELRLIHPNFKEALAAWSARTDLTTEEKATVRVSTGLGLYRSPVLLLRVGNRQFLLDSFGHHVQIAPRGRETIEASYWLVGEGSLSPQRAGQRYEFESFFLDLYKDRARHLRVQFVPR